MAENRLLRNQIDGCVQLPDNKRKELAELGAKLGKKVLEAIATVAQPDTILAWNRKFADQKVETSAPRQSVGRPRVDQEIEDWVIRMARENRSWGYDRMQGALKHLGYTISDQTVGKILKRHGMRPAPERKKTVTWREFVRSHLDILLATGFFTGHSALTYLAPYVFKVAISNHRIVGLSDRTVTFTYRKVGSTRLRRPHLDVMEFLRRFLQHVLPEGFQKVRHFGFCHASCAVPLATIRLMMEQAYPSHDQPPQREPPKPLVARCSDLWRPDARRHAPLDVTQGLC